MQGKFLGLDINGKYVNMETNCELLFTTDMLPCTPIISPSFKEFITGAKSWTVAVNALQALEAADRDSKYVLSTLTSDDPVFIYLRTKIVSLGFVEFSGEAIVTSHTLNVPNGKTNWQLQFQGTNQMEVKYEDYDLIDAMPFGPDGPYPEDVIYYEGVIEP